MKNVARVLALVSVLALSADSLAGALDKPGATPAPGASPAPGATPAGSLKTTTSLAPGPKSLKIIGWVVQKMPTGVVINAAVQRSREKPTGLTFIEGDFPKALVNDRIICMASEAGTYDYKPVTGPMETIRKLTKVSQ